MLRVFIAAALCAIALIGNVVPSALAGPYPNGPITLVNPYAAGGPADVLARTIIDPLKDVLGQPVVLLNKPGGATAIAAAYVAAAPPDGQTLLLGGASSHIVTPALTKVGYDGMRDFDFICMVAAVPNVLVVRPGLPATTVAELVSLAKQMPGKLNYGSVGIGSQPHLAAELFRQRTGTNITHVPYKGRGAGDCRPAGWADRPRIPQPSAASCPTSTAAPCARWRWQDCSAPNSCRTSPHWTNSAIRALRSPPGTGSPPPQVPRTRLPPSLPIRLRRCCDHPTSRPSWRAQGAEVFYLPPKQFVAYLADDANRLRQLIKTANITGE